MKKGFMSISLLVISLSMLMAVLKRYFLRLTSKTENIYRKTIKKVRFSIIIQEI